MNERRHLGFGYSRWWSGWLMLVISLIGPAHGAAQTAFGPDSLTVASVRADGAVLLWESATGRRLFELEGHKAPVTALAFSPTGHRLVTAAEDGAAIIWSSTTGDEMARLPHRSPVISVRYSQQGSRILTVARNGEVSIWFANGENLARIKLNEAVRSADISPDGTRVAILLENGDRYAWDEYDASDNAQLVSGASAAAHHAENLKFLDDWVSAWSRKDMDAYFSFYSSTFALPDGMPFEAWQSLRRSRILGRDDIRIAVSDVRVQSPESNQQRITYRQRYRSGQYSDDCIKILDIRQEAGRWKIQRENVLRCE